MKLSRVKNKLLFLLIFPLSILAQEPVLRGTIWSDAYVVENVSVYNASRKTNTFTDSEGKFTIVAREKDTLEFSSMTMYPRMLIVKAEDLDSPIVIRLEPKANQIEEVVVHRYKLTGELAVDSKNIKIKEPFEIKLGMTSGEIRMLQFFDDRQSTVKNDALPPAMQPFMGINVLEVVRMIFPRKPSKRNTERQIAYAGDVFANGLRAKFPETLFTESLGIHPDEVGLFLQFCSAKNQPEKNLLDPGNELLLTEFLIATAAEFKENK